MGVFMFFSPLKSNRTLKSTLDYAWLEIDDATKSNLETYSIFVTSGNTGNIGIDISGIPSDYNASVEDSSGSPILSYKDNGVVYFSKPSDNFVRIKYSPIFSNGNSISGNLLANEGYSISSSDDLNKSYFSNYNRLKKDFNLPNRMNFGFVAKFNETYEIVALRNIPEESEVLSKNERFQAVSKSGIKTYVDVRVLVW